MPTRRAVLKGGVAAVATAGFGVLGTGRSAWASGPEWDRLRKHLSGRLVLPADAGYDVAKQLYWKTFDSVSPAAVAYCATVGDVRACLSFANHNDIPAAARSGGHSFGGYSTSTGLVIDVSGLNGIRVGSETTVVGPGAQLVDVVAAASANGVALAGGTCPTVAMGGYLQGGGIGFQSRAWGIGCDSLRSAQVVLADGSVVTCSERVRPDLFWALRGGGGGNFGIVTGYERRNSPISPMVNFTLAWSWDDVVDVLAGWQRWLPGLPETLGPRWLAGLLDAAPGTTPFVVIDGAFLGSSADLAPYLDALVSEVGSQPLVREVQDLGFQDGMMSWFECSTQSVAECHTIGENPVADLPRGTFQLQRGRMFRDNVPDSGLAEMAAALDSARRAGQTRLAAGLALGGAVGVPSRTATAYVHRDATFTVDWAAKFTAATVTEEDQQAAREWIDNAFAVTDRYSSHETYQNYIDPQLADWRRAYYAENYPRLVAVKRAYDPHNFFRFQQSIG